MWRADLSAVWHIVYTIFIMSIDEKDAWQILHRYVADLLAIDADSVLAVYAIGSLGGGYYRSGQSDIDSAIIVQDGSAHIWGNNQAASPRLQALNQHYLEAYHIPKDFGPFALQARDLFPPYDPAQESVQEIARLKVQSRLVYGSFDLDAVPMPTPEDALRDAQHFESWWHAEFESAQPIGQMSEAACMNTILLHLRRFLWIKRNVIEFDKLNTVARYLANDPPFVDSTALQLVEASLAGQHLTAIELDQLRYWAEWLRPQMNACVGIELLE